jgi:hypothetical protein
VSGSSAWFAGACDAAPTQIKPATNKGAISLFGQVGQPVPRANLPIFIMFFVL